MSLRRRDLSPPPRGPGGGGPLGGGSKLRMDRNPSRAKITDPSHPAGKRKEIDMVMKKARAFPNETWDKKLLEVEEKDPNRWRHTGYKKLYIEDDPSSSDSDRGPGGAGGRYGNGRRSRSPRSPRPPHRRSPSPMLAMRKRHMSPHSPVPMRRRSPSPSPISRKPPPPELKRRPRSPSPRMRRKSPMGGGMMRRPLSPGEMRRRPSPPPGMGPESPRRPPRRMSPHLGPPPSKGGRLPPVPRSKRPPSPPPRMSRSASMSSCSDDSCSGCSVDDQRRRRRRSRSRSFSNPRPRVRSPPHNNGSKGLRREGLAGSHESRLRPMSPPPVDPRRKHLPPPPEPLPKGHRVPEKPSREHRPSRSIPQPLPEQRSRRPQTPDSDRALSPPKRSKHGAKSSSSGPVPEDARPSKVRPSKQRLPPPSSDVLGANGHDAAVSGAASSSSQTAHPAASSSSSGTGHKKHHKDKSAEKLRARVKIEGEPKRRSRPRSPSSGSEESSSSESSLPRFTATTRMTLSERFGKMAQWSVDRSNMENMRITKNSAGGDLKVMIEEELEAPPTRYTYSPAPAGHFPEELMTTGPSGLSSWDDVRVRYEYYKGRGYLRDLDLQDYVKWEEWWYKYQEWLKQERYYELWERSQMSRRRKKIPISQRLN
ncbi:serine/arginine repetitive matrix protein 1 [Anopheles gambiae]|uniref:serine/arginine repetitive matrix protein 1 n=1 Tax=Anopheles gambiae TaxID=7165 RepID=UPI002AC96F3C|nr:serine/arginine repetitive matrix protein 1 [Anopheles gambiae]XP_061499469.1 serine/arginine repetitive matrix protein 1 [Anopheles gambiae]